MVEKIRKLINDEVIDKRVCALKMARDVSVCWESFYDWERLKKEKIKKHEYSVSLMIKLIKLVFHYLFHSIILSFNPLRTCYIYHWAFHIRKNTIFSTHVSYIMMGRKVFSKVEAATGRRIGLVDVLIDLKDSFWGFFC